jgi:hypothetical protein
VVAQRLPKPSVAGSNPVSRSTPSLLEPALRSKVRDIQYRQKSAKVTLNPRPGVAKGVCPLRGVTDAKRRREGAGPLAGAGEAGFRADPATERGSNPVSRSTPSLLEPTLRSSASDTQYLKWSSSRALNPLILLSAHLA